MTNPHRLAVLCWGILISLISPIASTAQPATLHHGAPPYDVLFDFSQHWMTPGYHPSDLLAQIAVVEIPDASLELAIRNNLLKPDGPLFQTELASMEDLAAIDMGISSLEGLQFCLSISTLVLSGNQISNLAPLANLMNLAWLDLTTNQVSDLSPLVSNSGLGSGDIAFLRFNPLSQSAQCSQIPILQGRGVAVDFDQVHNCN